MGSVQFSPGVTSAIEQFLTAEEGRRPGTTKLLRNAHACAVGSSGNLASCLCGRVKSGGLGQAYWFPEDHTSQFRERQAVLDKDMSWSMRSSDRLAHIDLWVHTTFSLRSGDAGASDEATASAVDFPSEQLRLLRGVVGENLPQYLTARLKSPTYDDFMMPVEDFVIVQRLMRAALAGSMGRDFPVTKLIELERATRTFVPYQPTIRWEPAGQEEFTRVLSQGDRQAAKVFGAWLADSRDRVASNRPLCGRVSM